MIKGIGIDIIELERIHEKMEKNNRFADRILTKKEKIIYEKLENKNRRCEFLAGRFAAKEAFSKAAGTGIGQLRFQDIEIVSDDCGAPVITVEKYHDYNLFLSISHSKTYAVAQVIIEQNNGRGIID